MDGVRPFGVRNDLSDLSLQVAQGIVARQDRLMDIVSGFATAASARDELHRSVKTVSGAWWEMRVHDPGELSRVTVFLPSNNVLYSYFLFGVVPALYSREVMLRPSSRSISVVGDLHKEISSFLPAEISRRIRMCEVSQREFVRESETADAVVFTGQYENGLDIIERVGGRPRVLMMGSGPNPFVVGPEADVSLVVRSLLRARMYNSGQDCLAPDVVFVHESVAERFLGSVTGSLGALKVGERRDPSADLAPLIYSDAVQGAVDFLREHGSNIVYGGEVEVSSGLVEPHVLMWETDTEIHPDELFAPILAIVPYSSPEFIHEWSAHSREDARGMYISIFGEPGLRGERVGTASVRREVSALDSEEGNQPFGGFGTEASSVHHEGRIEAGPLLLSAQAALITSEEACRV